MAGKKTRALTQDEFFKLVETLQKGGYEYNDRGVIRVARPNDEVATMVVVQANIGVRICDLVSLKPKSILVDGEDYMLDIVEKKTGKLRNYVADEMLVNIIKDYYEKNEIGEDEFIFNMTERNAQIRIKAAAEHLKYKNVSTHSIRKYFATNMYELSNHDLVLVSRLLLHSDTKTTLRYIGISKDKQKKLFGEHTKNPLKKGE